MAFKSILVLCAAAFLVQTISTQCIGNIGLGNGLAGMGSGLSLGYGLGSGSGLGCASSCGAASGINIAAVSGGPLGVSTASPIYPNGLSVLSNNDIRGDLSVYGQLPFLAAVALDGTVPSSGSAGVNYGCGNGNVGIVQEGLGADYGAGYGADAGTGISASLRAGAPLSLGRGSCGCNGFY